MKKIKILGLPIRRRLLKTAVPSLNLPSKTQENYQNLKVQERKLKSRKSQSGKKVNVPIDEEPSVNEIIIIRTEYEQEENPEDFKKKYEDLLKDHNKLKMEMNSMKTKLKLQQKEIRSYKIKMYKLSKTLVNVKKHMEIL